MNFESTWTWPELTLMIVIIGLLVFWDFRYQPAQRRTIRLICSLIAMGALISLYLKPTLKVDAPQRTGAIFTTPITSEKKDSILQDSELIEIPLTRKPGELPYTINTIEVHGHGLESWQLERIEGYDINWNPSALEEGITVIQVPEIVERVPFTISGKASIKGELMLSLIDPEGNAIVQKLAPKSDKFEFTTEVKVAGLFLYELLGIRGQDTIFSETLPVEVLSSRQANVLLLGSFPSFEWNYLKNHLGDLGLGVASKFQLSKDVSHMEFLNMAKLNLNKINKKLLQSFKLLIIDGSTFGQLSTRQKKEIYQAVELAELGLFLMVNELSELESIAKMNAINGKGEVVVSSAEKSLSLLKMPFSVRDQKWDQLTFQDQEVGAYTRRGIGKIGFSMIASSHVLELQGAPEVYGQLWDRLLSPIIGFEIAGNRFNVSAFNFVDRQADIFFSYFGQPRVSIDGEFVPSINSPIRPDLWSFSYWPQKTGWHTIQLEEEDKAYFFVHDSKEWEVLQRYERQQYNEHFFETNTVVTREQQRIEKPVSRWIPFVVFLIAITGLWLERKLG